MSPSRLTVEAWPVTDPGQAGENQDAVLIYEPSNATQVRLSGNLYIVADGLGTGARGKLASEYTARRVMHYYYTSDEPDLGLRLRDAIEVANLDLVNYAKQQPEQIKIGVTIVAAAVRGEELHVASVGDSRAYVIRDGEIRQLTKDHTLVQQLLDESAITEDEAMEHPRRDVVLRSLGAEEIVRVDVVDTRLKPDDALVMCSDGMTRYLHTDEIASIVGSQSPRSAAETLVRKTLDRGGKENVTVVAALLRDGAPPVQTITEHMWDGQPASFDQQATLMIRRTDLSDVAPIPGQTTPSDVDARQFLEQQSAPVGTSLPPDIPEPPVTSGDTMVHQRPQQPFEPPTPVMPLPPVQPPLQQPAPGYQQNVQPAPQFNQPVQPAPQYGQRGAQRGYPQQGGYAPPPGYAIDPVTGLPPVAPGSDMGGYPAMQGGYPPQGGGYGGGPQYPQYGPRGFQQGQPPKRRGIPMGRFLLAGLLAVILTAIMVVVLVNPMNWSFLPFGGGASTDQTPTAQVTEIAGVGTTPTTGGVATQPAVATDAGTPGATPGTVVGPASATPNAETPEGMVRIDGGGFMRGVSDQEMQDAINSCIQEPTDDPCPVIDFDDAQPNEEVTLSPFFIDVTEVTNVAYAECVASEVCTLPSDTQYYNDQAYAQHPVVFVNYNQAVTYCQWAGKRLPTEAEWEKAARWDDLAQRSYVWPWGDAFESGRANTLLAGQGGTTAVQAFSGDISPYDVLGMAGNVSEWVLDWYFPDYTGLGLLDPMRGGQQPLPEPARVVRGGWFDEYASYSRAGHRLSGNPNGTGGDWLGFRCARSLDGSIPVGATQTPAATATGGATLPPTITPSPQP
jgi:serine/threonine protein phosphatase PrpC/formylglycine-generating enzyme required for sulfatase activity